MEKKQKSVVLVFEVFTIESKHDVCLESNVR